MHNAHVTFVFSLALSACIVPTVGKRLNRRQSYQAKTVLEQNGIKLSMHSKTELEPIRSLA